LSNQTIFTTCRKATPEDAAAASKLLQHEGMVQYSDTWLFHHFNDCFVALNANGDLTGILVSWKSPVAYNTVVVDALLLDSGYAENIAADLLDFASADFQCRCLRHVIVSAKAAPQLPPDFWRSKGFEAQEGIPGNLSKTLLPLRICLQGKKMRPNLNTGGGQVSEQTIFEYQQDGDTVWGTYHGGEVKRGVLVGKMNASRDMSITYMQIDNEGKFYQGTSKSSTEYLNDGRLVLYEDWIWTGGDRKGEGNAIIEEIKE